MIGAMVSPVSVYDFFRDPVTLRYLVANLAFLNFLQPSLTDVFMDNRLHAINGSLWTIKIEVMLYLLVPFLCFGYRYLGKKWVIALVFAVGISWVVIFFTFVEHPLAPALARQFPAQLPYFALGSVIGLIQVKPTHNRIILLVGLLYFVFFNQAWAGIGREILHMVLYPLVVCALAHTRIFSIGVGRFGDFSYGIYLYHFPTIQLLVQGGVFEQNAIMGLMASIGITGILAVISWHLIEKPLLKRRRFPAKR